MNKYLIFDIGGTFIKWAIANENFKIIENNKFAFDSKTNGAKKMLVEIGRHIEKITQVYEIKAIGISTAGVVDPESTKILGGAANIKDYKNLVIKDELKQYSKLPIFIENDANAAAIGETVDNQIKNFKDILFMTLGTDIGGGIIINNEIYRGHCKIAGEIGYQTIEGKRWGDYYSAQGLIRLVKETNNMELTTHQILESKDLKIKSTLDAWYQGIARGIANMQLTMNFEAIIIGGGISDSQLFDIKKIDEYIKNYLIDESFKNSYKLFKASQGNHAAIMGMIKTINNKINC